MKKGIFLTSHLREINKSYIVHFKDAFYYGLRLLIGGLAAIIHAIFPFILTSLASDTVNDLHKINAKKLNKDN
tara:strand:+ start:151 stop:369 length:219 start_codon:yes stop_codon:yes gene_type:complete